MPNRTVKPFSPALLLGVALLATAGPLSLGDVASAWAMGNGGQSLPMSTIVDWSNQAAEESPKAGLFETMGRVARQFQSLHGQMLAMLAGQRDKQTYNAEVSSQTWTATSPEAPPQAPLRANMLNLPPPTV